VAEGGWEYNAVAIGATLAIIEDELGPGWALASGLAGAAGSFAASELARRMGPEDEFEAVPFRAGEQEPATRASAATAETSQA
jgi:hypothetical protein